MQVTYTIDQEFSLVKFSPFKFSLGFIFVVMTTQMNQLTKFIRGEKYFAGLISVVEGDCRKFFHYENFQFFGSSKGITHFLQATPQYVKVP